MPLSGTFLAGRSGERTLEVERRLPDHLARLALAADALCSTREQPGRAEIAAEAAGYGA